MNDLVSIIIPVYNSEKFLAESINSALSQTWEHIEIIVIDDGSTDNSLSVAKSFESEKVRVFQQTNKGASAARNLGLQKARGKYVQFLDADDLISCEKIEIQVKVLQSKPEYISLCPTVYFTDGENHLMAMSEDHWSKQGSDFPVDFLIKLYGGEIFGAPYGGLISLHAWLSPKSILDRADNWNESLTVDDDGEYFSRVILASKGVVHSPGVYSYYRKHNNHKSLSSALNPRAYQSMLYAIDLKFQHIYKASRGQENVKKIFAAHYANIGINAYPQYKTLSNYGIERAKELGQSVFNYRSGPVTTFLSKIFGWRIMRTVTYLRYKV